MKKVLLLILAAIMQGTLCPHADAASVCREADDSTTFVPSFSMSAETRLSWREGILDGKSSDKLSGFHGDYVNIKLSGELYQDLSFSYRQRLNRLNEPSGFFNSIDYLYINYKKSDWTLSCGKQVVLIGGFEYDRAPINLYVCSEYWQNIACYQLGVSATRSFKHDAVSVQLCQSPYSGIRENKYAFNLFWAGNHGAYSSLWSANAIQCNEGWMGYLALGNKFHGAKWNLELDFMERIPSVEDLLLKDFSVMAELSYKPVPSLNIFFKGTYDFNDSNSDHDFCLYSGTDLWTFGYGVEYNPAKYNDKLTLFTVGCNSIGKNGNPNGTLVDGYNLFQTGIKLSFDFK